VAALLLLYCQVQDQYLEDILQYSGYMCHPEELRSKAAKRLKEKQVGCGEGHSRLLRLTAIAQVGRLMYVLLFLNCPPPAPPRPRLPPWCMQEEIAKQLADAGLVRTQRSTGLLTSASSKVGGWGGCSG
jgi:hypothetical protein